MASDAGPGAWALLWVSLAAVSAGLSAGCFAKAWLSSRRSGGGRALVSAGLVAASAAVAFAALFAIASGRAGLAVSRFLPAASVGLVCGCASAAFPRSAGIPLLSLACMAVSLCAVEAGAWIPFRGGTAVCGISPFRSAGGTLECMVTGAPGSGVPPIGNVSVSPVPQTIALSVDYLECAGIAEILFGSRRFRLAAIALPDGAGAVALPAGKGLLERMGLFSGGAAGAMRLVTGMGTRTVTSPAREPVEFETLDYAFEADGSVSVAAPVD